MKDCLNCKEGFEEKRETAKFCSTSCRVMWNRKHGNKVKKDVIEPFQMQVLYKAMMDKLDSINFTPATPAAFDGRDYNRLAADEPLSFDKLKEPFTKPQRSFESYRQGRIECETQEQWEALKEEIMNDGYLSTKQKTLLTT